MPASFLSAHLIVYVFSASAICVHGLRWNPSGITVRPFGEKKNCSRLVLDLTHSHKSVQTSRVTMEAKIACSESKKEII